MKIQKLKKKKVERITRITRYIKVDNVEIPLSSISYVLCLLEDLKESDGYFITAKLNNKDFITAMMKAGLIKNCDRGGKDAIICPGQYSATSKLRGNYNKLYEKIHEMYLEGIIKAALATREASK